jgi:hypothetical protein
MAWILSSVHAIRTISSFFSTSLPFSLLKLVEHSSHFAMIFHQQGRCIFSSACSALGFGHIRLASNKSSAAVAAQRHNATGQEQFLDSASRDSLRNQAIPRPCSAESGNVTTSLA